MICIYINMLQKRIYIHAPDMVNTVSSVEYILDKIKKHNLNYDKIIMCCSAGYSGTLESKLDTSSLDIDFYEHNFGPDSFEYPTLHKIWTDSQEEDFYCLYLHAKGASKTNEQDILNSIAWMDYMIYGVIENGEICIDHLNKGAELVGSIWHWHYKGNFWWGRSSHLKEMPDPLNLMKERFNAEYWCCLGLWWNGIKKPKIKNLFYIPDLQDDSRFYEITKTLKPSDIPLDYKFVFIDNRIDPEQSQSLPEFINTNYKCAVGEIYMLEQDKPLLSYLKNFLEYDGKITLLRGDAGGSYYTMAYDEI